MSRHLPVTPRVLGPGVPPRLHVVMAETRRLRRPDQLAAASTATWPEATSGASCRRRARCAVPYIPECRLIELNIALSVSFSCQFGYQGEKFQRRVTRWTPAQKDEVAGIELRRIPP